MIYQDALTAVAADNMPRGAIMGWNIGTAQLSLANPASAADEPQAISSGGNVIYRSICCDRTASWHNVLTGQSRNVFDYTNSLSLRAPGYDEMWWGTAYPGNLSRLVGAYGNQNGIYNSHGDQNPLVPYNGRLYQHRSNAVIAFGPGPNSRQLPKLAINPATDPVQPPSAQDLIVRLETEVNKVVAAGNLNPGYYNMGQFLPRALKTAFENPGETLQTLTRAYPYLSPAAQQGLRTYLRQQFAEYFNPTMYARKGWAEGTPREAISYPSDISNSFATQPKRNGVSGWSWMYPQNNFYALWKYAQIVPEDAVTAYNLAKGKLTVPVPPAADLATNPYEHNAYIAGYIGFLNLQELAGKAQSDAALRAQVTNELNCLLALRVATFDKDTPWVDASGQYPEDGVHHRGLNLARNFMYLVPELGDYLALYARAQVAAALEEYNWVAPYWFVSRYEGAVDEGAMGVPYTNWAMFQARAYIFREPYAQLTKYLDAPGFARGDLYYMDNLIAAIEASGAAPQPTPTSGPTSPVVTPTPTRTASATVVGTPSLTPTATPTRTATPANTPTPTQTSVAPATPTATPVPAAAMMIVDLDGTVTGAAGNRWRARVTIWLHDQADVPVANADVTGAWSDHPGEVVTCRTNKMGLCNVSQNSLDVGVQPTVTYTILSVSHPQVGYAPASNHDSDGDSDGTTIVITEP